MACLGERFSGSWGSSRDDFGLDLIGGGDELRHGMLGVAQDDEESAQARFAQVECGLEDRRGQVAPAGPADGRAPDRELAGDIEQSPAGVAEAEHQGPFGEDLDLLGGREDQADVPAGASGLGMADVGARAGMNQGLASLGGLCPAGDVDQADQVALAIDQEKRPDAVAEPVEALDGGEAGGEAGGTFDVLVGRSGLIVLGAEQEGAGRDFSVLVSRERRDAKRLEGGGNAVRADRIEIVGDDQVFGLILEAIEAVRELLVEEPAESKVDGLDDHLDHAALGGQERRGIARLEHEPGSEPLDLDAEAVGVVVEPVVGLVCGAVPVDDASIAGDVEHRVGKEVLKRAPEHHMVNAHDSRNRPAGALAPHRRSQVRGLMHAFSCVPKETAMPVARLRCLIAMSDRIHSVLGRPIDPGSRASHQSIESGYKMIRKKDYRARSAQPTFDLNGFRGLGRSTRSTDRTVIEAALAGRSMK